MDDANEFLRPIVTAWLSKVGKGIEHKKPFQDVADQCMGFYCGAVDFLWQDEFKRRYVGNIHPKFKLSLCKAFELVALYGPTLYSQNPVRSVQPHPRIELKEAMLLQSMGITPDQMQQLQSVAQLAEQAMQQGAEVPFEAQQQVQMLQQIQSQIQQMQATDESEKIGNTVACELMEKYLSFTPREQPGGGLQQAAEDAITEGLVTGRGVLWPEGYSLPGSDRVLTGSFYDTNKNLITDPDGKTIEFGDTRWVCRKHITPRWELEEKYDLPKGTLTFEGKGKTRFESAEAQSERVANRLGNLEHERGVTFDLITWYEIFSIGGVGGRLSGLTRDWKEAFEDVVGDYAYICVCEDLPYPLNAPREKVAKATDDEVRSRIGALDARFGGALSFADLLQNRE